MALKTRNPDRYSCNYWHARNLDYDKGSDKTRVNLGGYIDAEDRTETYPTARDAKIVTLDGPVGLAEVYDRIKAQPEWADATDC